MDRPQQGEASQVIPNLLTVVVQVNSDGVGCGSGFKFVVRPQTGKLTSSLASLDCPVSRHQETVPLRGGEDYPRLRQEGKQVCGLLQQRRLHRGDLPGGLQGRGQPGLCHTPRLLRRLLGG